MKVCLDTLIRKPAEFRHRRFGLVAAVAVLSLFTAGSAWSQQHYKVDPATSEVHFTLGGSHTVDGLFKVSSGEFSLDPQSGTMTGMVSVDASSGNSNEPGRDKKMTNDQMKAKTFPMVSFAPTRFTGQLTDSGDSTGQVEGNFTLLGQAHPIAVTMTVHMEGDHFMAAGSFVVPYVSWGMKDPSWLVMKEAKEVKIALKLAGTVTK
jgi:polyisoprenoid-binding protein YceI